MKVDANGQKVYVHYNNGTCAARLCDKSAEFYDPVTSRCEYMMGCKFETFQQEVLKRYGAEVKESHRPTWSVSEAGHHAEHS